MAIAKLVKLDQPLDREWLWRGVQYPAGTTELPEDLAQALNERAKTKAIAPPPEPESEKSPDSPLVEPVSDAPEIVKPHPAIALINGAESPSDVSVLPGIGKGAGDRILKKRPAEGYASFDQLVALNPELVKAPYRLDWEVVKQWNPANGVS